MTMNKKTKLTVIQIVTVLAIWVTYIYIFMGDPEVAIASLFGLKVYPYLIIVFGIISSFWKSLFQMGLTDMGGSNLGSKLLPLLYLILLCYCITLIPQTYATAVVSSLFIGTATSYVVKVIYQK